MFKRKTAMLLAAVMTFTGLCIGTVSGEELQEHPNYKVYDVSASGDSVESSEKELYRWHTGGVGIFGSESEPENCTVSVNDGAVNISTSNNNRGKLSRREDSFGYYGMWLPIDEDFEISCDMVVDLNTNDVNGKDQSCSGLFVLNDVYSTDELNTKDRSDNCVYLTQYIHSEMSEFGRFAVRMRVDGKDSENPIWSDVALSEEFPAVSPNYGPVHLKISKIGDYFVFDCEGRVDSYKINETMFNGDEILAGVFATRDAVSTFSNIEYKEIDSGLKDIEITKNA